MDKKNCKNHPEKKAISFCHNCKEYYCEDCIEEGLKYYYCKKPDCYSYIEKEKNIYEKYYAPNPRFCEKCIDETNPESTGNLETFNFIGSTIRTIGGLCPTCRSVIAEKRYVVLGIPIKSNGYFRVIYLSSNYRFTSSKETFISRKLKNQDISLLNVRKNIIDFLINK